MHAYAAAGDRAPRIVRDSNGQRVIECSRCGAVNSVSANACVRCAVPFTLEANAQAESPGGGLATASLVLGLVGLPTFCLPLAGLLGVIFGAVVLLRATAAHTSSGDRKRAAAGVILGLLEIAACGGWWLKFGFPGFWWP